MSDTDTRVAPKQPAAVPAPLDVSYETSRRHFFGRSGAVLGIAAAGTLTSLFSACSDDDDPVGPTGALITLPLTSDTEILQFALFLELLEADFYSKATSAGILSGAVATLAENIRAHEVAHVNFLVGALGADAFGEDDVEFDFGDALNDQASFLATAQTLEATGVGAYLGALPAISSRSLRTSAGSIYAIEARHLSGVRAFNNAAGGPVPAAFETPLTPEAVVAAVVGTGFVTAGLG